MQRKTGWAVLLIAFGALILLHKVGFHMRPFVGSMMGYVIPLAMIGLGYVGIKNGGKIGWIMGGLGVLILLGKLSGLIVILLALGLIGYGILMLSRKSHF